MELARRQKIITDERKKKQAVKLLQRQIIAIGPDTLGFQAVGKKRLVQNVDS
jgi:hypothetical protein